MRRRRVGPLELFALVFAVFAVRCSSPTKPGATLTLTHFTAFGDSITWGTASAPGAAGPKGLLSFPITPPSYSYPSQLRTFLAANFPALSVSVANEGWPGEAVGDGLTRLPTAITETNPDVLLLLDGANDLLGNPSSATTEYIAARLRDMVRAAKVQRPSIKVLLATFPPQARGTIPYDRGAGRDFIPELNQRIAAVANSESASVVDLYSAFPTDLRAYIGVDGLHPTELGFTLIAQTFAARVQQLFVR